jgi:hypothetical protein
LDRGGANVLPLLQRICPGTGNMADTSNSETFIELSLPLRASMGLKTQVVGFVPRRLELACI